MIDTKKNSQQQICVITYRDEYQKDFEKLNLEWIEKYFWIEESDRKYLQNPRHYIIEPGGEIFFVLVDNIAVGTCALVKEESGVYELSKMAVSAEYQGRGFSNLLMQATVEWARDKNASMMFLFSNRSLTPALRLYEKFGFREVVIKDNAYERSDIRMELDFADEKKVFD